MLGWEGEPNERDAAQRRADHRDPEARGSRRDDGRRNVDSTGSASRRTTAGRRSTGGWTVARRVSGTPAGCWELGRSTYRYRARKPERDSALRARLKELAAKRMRFRISTADGDAGAGRNVRLPQTCVPAVSRGNCGSTGRVIRMLTVADECTRGCPAIEVDTSLSGLCVRRVLGGIASERGLPEAIVLNTGRSSAGERWPRGAKNAGCGWNLFRLASRHRTPTQKAMRKRLGNR